MSGSFSPADASRGPSNGAAQSPAPADSHETKRDGADEPSPPPLAALAQPVPVIPIFGADASATEVTFAVPSRRFCTVCGSRWVDGAEECAACIEHAVRRAALHDEARREGAGKPVQSALGLYFTWLGISIVGAVVTLLMKEERIELELLYAIVSSFMVLVWCFASRRDVLPGLRVIPNGAWFGAAAGMAGITFFTASGALWVLHRTTAMPVTEYTPPFFRAGYGWGMIVLCICVQPAVFEELAFRGIILTGLQRVIAPVEAVLVSSLMFMILHLSIPSFPHLLVIGLALGFLRVRSGSLYPGMLLHFTHNLLCVVSERHRGWPW
jgi:uncharacterized protein